jgi:hypothetical protein
MPCAPIQPQVIAHGKARIGEPFGIRCELHRREAFIGQRHLRPLRTMFCGKAVDVRREDVPLIVAVELGSE